MEEEVPKESKFKQYLRSWQFWVGIFALAVSIAMTVWLILNREHLEGFSNYGYAGAFIVSVLGGAVSIVPVPMAIVQFTLGPVAEPWFGPQYLAPIFIGIVSGIGEGLGCLVTYYTGFTGRLALTVVDEKKKQGRIARWTQKAISLMQNHGMLVLFVLSATMNPFYYPVAIASGVMKYDVKKFVIMSVLGKIIKSALIAYCGYFGLSWILGK
ncbi:MAG: VTT domain-containing protein [Dehalococcoidales bacterium]|nr:VTT domain-containing protein [Dehalococcoidales bacterium]